MELWFYSFLIWFSLVSLKRLLLFRSVWFYYSSHIVLQNGLGYFTRIPELNVHCHLMFVISVMCMLE